MANLAVIILQGFTIVRVHLSDRARITEEMAMRLEAVLGKPDASHWLRLQNAYDLWQVRQKFKDLNVHPIEHAA